MAFKFAIFASGSGSNACAIISQAASMDLKPEFVFVNNKNATVIDKVKSLGIDVIVLHQTKPQVDVEFEQQLLVHCQNYQVKWVFLAGFMKILGQTFLAYFKENSFYRVINIHPSLLPEYPGLRGYERAFTDNKNIYGHTIHLVDEKIDHGPILYQGVLKRAENDTLEDFKERGINAENTSYKKVFASMSEAPEDFILKHINNCKVEHLNS